MKEPGPEQQQSENDPDRLTFVIYSTVAIVLLVLCLIVGGAMILMDNYSTKGTLVGLIVLCKFTSLFAAHTQTGQRTMREKFGFSQSTTLKLTVASALYLIGFLVIIAFKEL
jgi:hypothetical protein